MDKRLKFLLSLLLIATISCLSIYYVLVVIAPESKEDKIIVILKTNKIHKEFWQTVSAGMKSGSNEFDAKIEIRGPLSETDPEEQIDLINQAILEKPRVIILAPTDADLLVPSARKIRENGIQLIVIHSALNDDLAQAFIATDHIEAGKKAGITLATATDGLPKMAIIHHTKGAPIETERENSILQTLENYPGMINYGTYYSGGHEDEAYELTKKLLKDHPDLNGIIGLNETAILGASKAVKELNKANKIKLVGFGNSIYQIMLMEEGIILATVVQKPFNMGYLGIKTAVQLIQGERIDANLNIDSVVVTTENMYSQENQGLLFPLVER